MPSWGNRQHREASSVGRQQKQTRKSSSQQCGHPQTCSTGAEEAGSGPARCPSTAPRWPSPANCDSPAAAPARPVPAGWYPAPPRRRQCCTRFQDSSATPTNTRPSTAGSMPPTAAGRREAGEGVGQGWSSGLDAAGQAEHHASTAALALGGTLVASSTAQQRRWLFDRQSSVPCSSKSSPLLLNSKSRALCKPAPFRT